MLRPLVRCPQFPHDVTGDMFEIIEGDKVLNVDCQEEVPDPQELWIAIVVSIMQHGQKSTVLERGRKDLDHR